MVIVPMGKLRLGGAQPDFVRRTAAETAGNTHEFAKRLLARPDLAIVALTKRGWEPKSIKELLQGCEELTGSPPVADELIETCFLS